MRRLKSRTLGLLTAIILLSLACSIAGLAGEASGEFNDPQNASSPEGNQESTDSQSDDSPNDSIDLDVDALYTEISGTNYTVHMDFNFTLQNEDGSLLYRELVLTGMRNAEPPESYFRIDPNDPAVMDGIDFMEIVDLEGTDYVYSPEQGCNVFGQEEFNNPFDSLIDTGGILSGEALLLASGETVNGVLTDVYQITQDNIDLSDPTASDFIELQEGLIYVARGEQKVIRVRLAGRGISELLTGSTTLEGDIAYQLDFTPTDEIFDILPPEDCNPPMEDTALPLMPDATNVSSVSGLISYSSASSPEAVLDFYKAEMAALGFTVVNELNVTLLLSAEFNDGSTTVTLLISPGAVEGSSVTITSGFIP
jgi:hypothetical protein